MQDPLSTARGAARPATRGVIDRAKRGGVVIRVDGNLRYVPDSVAARLAPAPRVTPVPGAPPQLLGITLYEGVVIPVLAVGAVRAEMVICQNAGELVGLVGGEVLKTGLFDVVPGRPDVLEVDGGHATPLDVAVIYARVQAQLRPGRLAQ